MKKYFLLVLVFITVSFDTQKPGAYDSDEWFKFRIHYGFINAGYATLEIKAPIKKKGFLRPNFGDHVPSLIAPIIGCKTKPVIGPASQSIGKLASSAPKYL